MVTALNTATTSFNKSVVDFISKTIIANLRAGLVQLPVEATILASHVKGTNGVYRFIAYDDPAPSLTALVETVPQDATGATALAISYDEFTAARYFSKFTVTDEANRNSPHDLMGVLVERSTHHAVASIDKFVSDSIWEAAATLAAMTVIRPPTYASRVLTPATAVMTGTLLSKAVALLGRRNVRRIGSTVDSKGVETGGNYLAIAHPDIIGDLQQDTAIGGWISSSQYAAPSQLLTGEVGMYRGIRIIQSSAARKYTGAGAAGADIYRTIVMGRDAIAFADMGDLQVEVYPPGSGNGERTDIFGQIGLVGWAARLGGTYVLSGGAPNGRAVAIETSSSLSGVA